MDNQNLKEIFDRVGPFGILVGDSYGVDEMGAALSIYLALKSLGKDASIVSTKTPIVEVSNLVGIDAVKELFESQSGDLVVSFPYREDEIGKVSYTLENGFLNIIVKPKEGALSFGEKDVAFKRTGATPAVLFTVGVKRLSEVSRILRIEDLKDTTIVNIDKAGNNEGFGDIVLIGQGASSVSEQVANMLIAQGLPLDPDVSQNLISGIISATGNFQSPKTSSLAFEMAGLLLRSGARREMPRAVREDFRDPRSFGQAKPTRPFGQPRQQQVNQVNQVNNVGNIPQQFVPNVQNQQKQTTEVSREQVRSNQEAGQDAPPDWLAPKIFKGSTNVE